MKFSRKYTDFKHFYHFLFISLTVTLILWGRSKTKFCIMNNFFTLFRISNGWFLVPIIMPFFGTIIGVLIYQLMVGFHVEAEARERRSSQPENVRLTNVSTNNSKEATKEVH